MVPRPFSARFIVDNAAQGQTFLRVLPLLPVSIIRPLLHTHLHLIYALTRWIIKGIMGILKTSDTPPDITAGFRSKFLSRFLYLKGLNKHPGNVFNSGFEVSKK